MKGMIMMNKQPTIKITKKDRRRAAVRYNFMACNIFNYESQMGPAVAWALAPALRKIYDDDDEYQEALENHFNYYNSTTVMSSLILGASLAMEERDGIKAKTAVQSLKTSLMGPMAGVGDTLVWVLWPTIMGSISGYMALQGNPLGAIVWLIANIVFWFVKLKMFDIGFTSGTKLITSLGERLNIFTESASIVGLSVVGALVATVVKISMPVKFAVGKVTLNLQTGIFDKIMPALLPALLTLLIYHLLGNKKWTPTKIILLVIAISLVGTFLGIFKA
ncbi:PTS system mannose/fructose/sorbose family transporter subunit IID [Lactiplantibacillus paraplantarum]|uniref:PTS system mannose/fructose/sorbose family transporter subunit IID n=1 Tax=Lactiplantibacillus paraplantarum TaxID=60520 RepID=UPI0023AA6B9C|nr:PTS system mannose/fructose/sorbose family transporter subunit IID [Lactiplantibacillus paraplantarum]WEE34990.1 PTS system mannose/fructose/sorbose family transporter subunit IID [Lactiplantibacillus paraplantarum]